MKKIIMFVLSCLSLMALANDAPFWQPTDQGRVAIPQPRPQKFILDKDGIELQASMGEIEPSPPKVPDRKPYLTFYPCSQCHTYWETNPEPRKLAPVHAVGLQHGEGRLWCLDCHAGDARDHLRTLQDDSVDFNDAWIVCGQCHAARKKDWFFGAHGKRVSHWQGEAERYNCTHCHDPHRPAFIERKPQAKPGLRAGLQPVKRQTTRQPPVWEKKLVQATEVKKHE